MKRALRHGIDAHNPLKHPCYSFIPVCEHTYILNIHTYIHTTARNGSATEPVHAGTSQASEPYEHALRPAAAGHAAAGLPAELSPGHDARTSTTAGALRVPMCTCCLGFSITLCVSRLLARMLLVLWP